MLKRLTFTAAFAVFVLAAAPAVAQAATLDVLSPAKKKGHAVVVDVAYQCEAGLQPLEAHITVSQDDQRISGQSGLGSITCDGATHVATVTVSPLEGRFHKGEAHASAFMLLYDPATGQTVSVNQSETIQVR